MKKYTISAEMAMAQIAIENSLQHTRIQKKLAAYNYDRKKVLEGKSLLQEVQMLQSVKQDKYGKQFETADALKSQTQEVKSLYRKHVRSARLAFEKQRGIMEQLQLSGRRKGDVMGLLEQIYAFYSKIEMFTEEMGKYNVGGEELTQAKAMVEAIYAIRQQQMQSKGDAQDATQKRDEKRRALQAWVAQFKRVARVALHDEPQLLEVLGIMVPSARV
ncbi:hypothetical protein [Catalinimonas niigatensis]|uniref:hypothetical protein n=1 Tax=Catalinimonas niigatensis TaxID=1397264 RepID=UPI002665F0F3|nr:hypothetical protein [Catalinimonas niigatensis]WPP49915.1 hypothetical protein PZB72_24915 [Catalinimonas niigatensis]